MLNWNLHSFQLLEIIQLLDSISWVRCASGNVSICPSGRDSLNLLLISIRKTTENVTSSGIVNKAQTQLENVTRTFRHGKIMDFLKAEIERKKRQIQEKNVLQPQKKYFKRGDLLAVQVRLNQNMLYFYSAVLGGRIHGQIWHL